MYGKGLNDFFLKKMDYRQEIEAIASNMKKLRQSRKMTVQELAYRCEMERSNLSRIEAGKTNLTIKTICTICNALGAELRDVIK